MLLENMTGIMTQKMELLTFLLREISSNKFMKRMIIETRKCLHIANKIDKIFP